MRNTKIILGGNTVIAIACSAFQVVTTSTSAKLSRAKFVAKEKGVEIQIPKKLDSLINTVMDEMNLSKGFRGLIKPYLCIGLNPIHYGHVKLLSDTYIGFPQNFTVDERVHFNLKAMVDDINLPADSPDYQTLKSSLVLSDNAKKFAIAESLYEITGVGFIAKLLLPLFCAGVVNTLIYIVTINRKKYEKNFRYIYISIAMLALSLYLFSYDLMSIYIQAHADFLAAELGKSYIEGGREYYEKILERNKIIKKLNEKARFTNEGESDRFTITTNLRYKTRCEFFNMYEKSKENSLFKYICTALFSIY